MFNSLPPSYSQCQAELLAKRVTCRSSLDGRYEVFNYAETVEFDDTWNDVNVWCRGLVFDVGVTPPVCVAVPFKKFWNIGQRPETRPDVIHELGEPIDARAKLDGCCDENTTITTDAGKLTIKEICESDSKVKILSFNVNTGIQEYKDILNTSIMSQANNWYELELENGTILRLAGNHRIWLPELLCYRRVDELIGDEQILLI